VAARRRCPWSWILLLGLPLASPVPAQPPPATPPAARPLEQLDLVVAVGGDRDLSTEVGLLRRALGVLPKLLRAFPGRVTARYGLVSRSPVPGAEAPRVLPLTESPAALLRALEHLEASSDPGLDAAAALEPAFGLLGEPGEDTTSRHVWLVTGDAPPLDGAYIGEWFTFLQGAQEKEIVVDVLAAPLVQHELERWQVWRTLTGVTYGVALPVPAYHSLARTASAEISARDPDTGRTRRMDVAEQVVRGPPIPFEDRLAGAKAFVEWTLRNEANRRGILLDEEAVARLR